MSFDRDDIARAVAEGPVARILVVETRGSVPRSAGTSMLVGPDWTEGTIGGGALEFAAIENARKVLAAGKDQVERHPLGPALGQCCGGAVTLLTEVWSETRLNDISEGDIIARPAPGGSAERPLTVTRLLSEARSGRRNVTTRLIDGWIVEPVARPERAIWIWGAGHVGRALVNVLAPLPALSLTWADSGEDRFPDTVPHGIQTLTAANPADLVPLAPSHAEHYVLTYSHALDLEICHRVLGRPFAFLGLIGSDTKRARFRSRLAALGHTPAQIDRMICPIGDPFLGKHPQEIALGVGAEILARGQGDTAMIGKQA
ncbi:xanthine dehydrogenase accessory protein XdhC [Alphaproteobacteria bacterium GH1-50]|uniref:Xanthine dehydrogenase accessory protein XdhC n=1 Tax=Kangsaoukella pontilimi TaxID=2691042 RepID=A0A7C9IGL8_9RHOB|nr:xanthine dehydrogenase accessory protein XdhC [Kangsaoukella pontilimi]